VLEIVRRLFGHPSLVRASSTDPLPLISAQDSDLAKKFVSVWRLVSIEGTQAGLPADFWDRPTGMIIYLPTGKMAVQIANKIHRKSLGRNRAQWYAASPEDKAAVFDSYAAYYGTYTIDRKAGTLTPPFTGLERAGSKGRRVRWYEFQGNDRIVLIPV
jgi:hypothetical protein